MRENPGVKKERRNIWDSFAEVIGAGVELKPVFAVSGDLFHAAASKKRTSGVNYLFSRIPQTKIILMAGNHDYLRTKSYYLTMEWEENVYFFRQEEPGHFDFEEENVSIYGLSYWHREIGEPVYDSIIPEDLFEDQHSFGTWRRSAAYSIPSEAYSGKWV